MPLTAEEAKRLSPPPFLVSTEEEARQDYMKEAGDSTGENAMNSEEFAKDMEKKVAEKKENRFLKGAKAAVEAVKDPAAIMNKIVDANDKLAGEVLSKGGTAVSNALTKLGLDSVNKIALDVFDGLVNAIFDELAKFIFIPDAVYTAMLIGFDIAGADLEMKNNYIRKLILKRDITMALQWWNKEWEIHYTGLPDDIYTSDTKCARDGAFENVMYICGEYQKQLEKLEAINSKLRTETTNEEKNNVSNAKMTEKQLEKHIESKLRYNSEYTSNLGAINTIRNRILKTIKDTIVYSYTNFSTNDLKKMIQKFNIDPSIFGTTNKQYGTRYTITATDLDMMVPLYIPPEDSASAILSDKIGGVMGSLDNSRSSRWRRMQKKQGKAANFIKDIKDGAKDALKMINPRNKNIKRLYLVLTEAAGPTPSVSSDIMGKGLSKTPPPPVSPMYNEEFAKRLKYPIATVVAKVLDNALGSVAKLLPDLDLKLSMEEIYNSAYDYTKKIEDWLYDPANTPNFNLLDLTVIKAPPAIGEMAPKPNNGIVKPDKDAKENVDNANIGGALALDEMKANGLELLQNPDLQAYLSNLTKLFLSLSANDMIKIISRDINKTDKDAEWLRGQFAIKSSIESIIVGYFMKKKFIFFFNIDFLTIQNLIDLIKTAARNDNKSSIQLRSSLRDTTITELLTQSRAKIDELVHMPNYMLDINGVPSGDQLYNKDDIVRTAKYIYYKCLSPCGVIESIKDNKLQNTDENGNVIKPEEPAHIYRHGDIVQITNQYFYEWTQPNHDVPEPDEPGMAATPDENSDPDAPPPPPPVVSLHNEKFWKKIKFPDNLLSISDTKLSPDHSIDPTGFWQRVDKMNRPETIKVYMFVLGYLHDIIQSVLKNDYKAADVSLDDLIVRALDDIKLDLVPGFGEYDDEAYLMIGRMNKLIQSLKLTLDNINDQSLFRKIMDDIAEIARTVKSIIADKTFIDRKADPIKQKAVDAMIKLSDSLKYMDLSGDALNNFINDGIKSIEETVEGDEKNKYNLDAVNSILGEYGVDASQFRDMNYFKELSDKINSVKPDNYYDFDVENPPPDVIKSIQNEWGNGPGLTYRWRGEYMNVDEANVSG